MSEKACKPNPGDTKLLKTARRRAQKFGRMLAPAQWSSDTSDEDNDAIGLELQPTSGTSREFAVLKAFMLYHVMVV